jgi:hypothetical protein
MSLSFFSGHQKSNDPFIQWFRREMLKMSWRDAVAPVSLPANTLALGLVEADLADHAALSRRDNIRAERIDGPK